VSYEDGTMIELWRVLFGLRGWLMSKRDRMFL